MSSGDIARSLKPGRPKVDRTPKPSSMAFDEVVDAIKAIPPRMRPKVKEQTLKAASADVALSGATVRVFHWVVEAINWRTGVAEASIGWLAEKLSMHRDTARKALRQAQDAGHLLRRHKRRPGSHWCDTGEHTFPEMAHVRAPAEKPCAQAEAGNVEAGNVEAGNVEADSPGGRGETASRVEADSPGGRGESASESHGQSNVTKPMGKPMSHARVRARDRTNSDSPRLDDQGLTGDLPALWPSHILGPVVEAKVRKRGQEPQAVWDRIVDRNARSISNGKGPLQINNLAGYVIRVAEDMRNEQLAKARDPSALEAFRASRGPAWRPSGGKGR
jgi:hypothetical protein